MPAYINNAQVAQVSAVYPGDSIAVVTPADTGLTTSLQFAVGPTPGNSTGNMVIVNTTTQTAQGEYAVTDATANYANLSGCIIPAGTTLSYNLNGGWLRFTFSVAPTSGSLIISR